MSYLFRNKETTFSSTRLVWLNKTEDRTVRSFFFFFFFFFFLFFFFFFFHYVLLTGQLYASVLNVSQ